MDLEQTDLAKVEAAIETDKGTMVVTFFPAEAPKHALSFLKLAQQGFYDGIAFHRIVRNFMVQTGCPNSKKGAKGMPGTGGPGYRLQQEFNDIPHTRGILSMARAQDPNSAGSQFFIVHADHAAFLDGQYTVFGKVEEGLDVLDEIAGIECSFGPGGEKSTPKERVEIRHVVIRDRQPRGEAADGGAAGEAGGDSAEA